MNGLRCELHDFKKIESFGETEKRRNRDDLRLGNPGA